MHKKMKNEKKGNAKQKILDSAATIFAEKGFDGARVDEIAKKAGVNKALIYYYYESKEKILDELLIKSVDELIAQKMVILEEMTTWDMDEISKYTAKSLALLRGEVEIIKIAVIEAMKSNKNDTTLFKMIDMFFNRLIPQFKNVNLNVENKNDLLITGFFFGLVPVIFSMILGEKWAEYHNIDKNEFDQSFNVKVHEIYVKFVFDFFKKKEEQE